MTAPRRVVLASGNAGKLREFAALLAPLDIELIPQTALGIPSADETGDTFEANALIKARHAASAARLPALADDSGIEVDALGGRPGVWSARYAGPAATDTENNALLLRELDGVPPVSRGARYRCVIAYVASADDVAPLCASGSWEGTIATTPAGDGGFGYDPLFMPQGSRLTAAQLPAIEKNAVSHRAAALAELLRLLR
jgi:XTP/dITP diphosphohydrolase